MRLQIDSPVSDLAVPWTEVNSPARKSRANILASRRLVLTWSEGFWGMSEGAMTSQGMNLQQGGSAPPTRSNYVYTETGHPFEFSHKP